MKAIIDCNSFYCACETLFRPEYKNKPVIVLSNNDGCIISRSDEAKALGIKMAAPFFQVRSLVSKYKTGVFSSNYNLYGEMSQRVMDTLKLLAGENNVEVYSIDESFIELSHIQNNHLEDFCIELKKYIEHWTGIAVSIGLAKSKILCKVANRIAKGNKIKTKGVVSIMSDDKTKDALLNTNVEDIWGIGHQFSLKLKKQGIMNAWNL